MGLDILRGNHGGLYGAIVSVKHRFVQIDRIWSEHALVWAGIRNPTYGSVRAIVAVNLGPN